jgi:NAD(P)H dehydrogenase (quinone)
MTKVLVLYYSSYGHIEQMAYAVAEGGREVEGAEVVVKRVPELVPEEVAKKAGMKLDQPAPIATVDELPQYDAVIVGCGTRYGGMTSQMRSFFDQTGSLWMSGALVGKVASAFSSSATQHGGNETTVITAIPFFLHMGMAMSACPTAARRRWDSTRSRAAAPTVRRRSPAARASASPPSRSWAWPATRAGTWRASPRS